MIVSEATKLSERKRRAVGRLIVGFEGLEPSSEMLDVLSGFTPAGAILFARNIESREQTLVLAIVSCLHCGKMEKHPGSVSIKKAVECEELKSVVGTDDEICRRVQGFSHYKTSNSRFEYRSSSLGVYR